MLHGDDVSDSPVVEGVKERDWLKVGRSFRGHRVDELDRLTEEEE